MLMATLVKCLTTLIYYYIGYLCPDYRIFRGRTSRTQHGTSKWLEADNWHRAHIFSYRTFDLQRGGDWVNIFGRRRVLVGFIYWWFSILISLIFCRKWRFLFLGTWKSKIREDGTGFMIHRVLLSNCDFLNYS